MNNIQEKGSESLEVIVTEIMNAYGTELSTLAFSYVKDIEASKDIVQNVFIKCFTHLDEFEGRSSIRTWLYRITINQCKDYLRSYYIKKVFLIGQVKEEITVHSPESITLQKWDEEQVVAQIMNLGKKYREVLILRYIQELEVREIAEILSISNETVKTRIRRGKNKLVPMLKGEFLYD
ncbi:sigma-70 family RNA polymerase sigma factor [Cytobacillus sp. BC1816]|uniref:sigma-70 family RNA polymerase sigma factor n=1 Tax=Cytobacillus sp. BC1816 TaxID=3440154 RepID=UPI003F51555B